MTYNLQITSYNASSQHHITNFNSIIFPEFFLFHILFITSYKLCLTYMGYMKKN